MGEKCVEFSYLILDLGLSNVLFYVLSYNPIKLDSYKESSKDIN